MPAAHNNGLFRCTVLGHTPGGERWVNVFHVAQDDADGDVLTLPIATEIRDRFATFYNAIKGLQDVAYGVDQFVVKNLQAGHDGEQFELVPAVAIVGTGAGGPLPSQDAIVVSWKTPLAGRKFRGRTFLAGFAKSALDADAMGLTPANQAVVGNAARALLTGLAADNHALNVWSRIEPPVNGIATPVSAVRVGRIFDTQRRRRNRFNEAYVAF